MALPKDIEPSSLSTLGEGGNDQSEQRPLYIAGRSVMRRMLFTIIFLLPLAANAGVNTDRGVCDGLRDATPGLHGLCVAYCEAQGLGDAVKAESKKSSLSLLLAYERKRGPEDPDMPCMESSPNRGTPPPTAQCGCWTVDDLRTALPNPSACVTNGDYHDASQTDKGSSAVLYQSSMLCDFQGGDSGIASKSFHILQSAEEAAGCAALWSYHAEETGCL